MYVTKYSSYSTQELLTIVSEKRYHSPLIEELCQRLERFSTTCPVCEADIEAAQQEFSS